MPEASIKSIFILVGTHEDPFQRMSDLASVLSKRGYSVQYQYGHSSEPQKNNSLTCFQFCTYDKTIEYIQNADLVITHSGTGSIISCLHHGKKPIVIPRHKSLGEHIDDHQLEIANEFLARNFIYCIDQEDILSELSAYLQKDSSFFKTEKPILESKIEKELKSFFN